MVGYKSKQAMSAGAFYAPHVPKPVTWQYQLQFWEGELRSKYGYADALNVMSDCLDLMQAKYPGKYELSWQQTAPNEFHLQPVFKDPKHETLWKLKYEQ